MHSVQLDDVVFGLNFRHGRSQSCPFCRDSLRRVDSSDLWIYTDKCDVVDLSTILRENCKRLFLYIDKLPLIIPDSVIVPYDSHVSWVLIFTGFWILLYMMNFLTTIYVHAFYETPNCTLIIIIIIGWALP